MARSFSNVLERGESTVFQTTYTSMSGIDIKAVLAGIVFGNIQAISYSITREKVI